MGHEELAAQYRWPLDTRSLKILSGLGLKLILTLRRTGGWHPTSEVFFIYFLVLFFFLNDKTLASVVFSSCLFSPRAHFKTSLVMVSYYGYDI